MKVKNLQTINKSIILTFVLLFILQIVIGGAFFTQPVSAATLPSQTPTLPPTLVPTPRPTTGPTPTSLPTLSNFSTYVDNVNLTLSQLRISELVLNFPDTKDVFIKLPDQWQAKPSSTFKIHYMLYNQDTSKTLGQLNGVNTLPSMRIYVNGFLASTFTPQTGKDQYYSFEIPSQSVDRINSNTNNYFTFTFEYIDDQDYHCGYIGLLKIYDDSSFNVNYDLMDPKLDLSRFPMPISQNSSLPETIYFIVPDNYNGSDLSAASTTAAIINKTTYSHVIYKIVKESDRMNIPDKANVVVVGTPSRNNFLREVLYKPNDNFKGMPSSLRSDNKIYVESADRLLADDEGLVQIMQSVKNPRFSYLVITGNTDQGVELAAKGLSAPPIGSVGAGFIVASTFKLPDSQLDNVVTLKSLGFNNATIYGNGTYSNGITFYIPRNWKMEAGTKLVLHYRNSDNLDENNSSLAVYVNDQPSGSVKIDISKTGEKEVTIPINQADIRPGWLNSLRIEANSDMQKNCLYNPRAFLINIQDSSLLYLPHSLITDPKQLSPITHPIYYMGTKPSIYVSMPNAPTNDDLDMLMSFTSLFGYLQLPVVDFHVGINEDLSGKSGYNIVVIGNPSTNAQVAKINQYLPQRFVNGSNSLEQMVGKTTYQIPPGTNIGLIEEINSPFDPEMGLTLLSATTQDGMKYLYNRLTQNPVNLTELTGDLIFIGNKTTQAFQTNGVPVALDLASSGVTGTQVALQPIVPTSEAAATSTQVSKYVTNTSIENPVSQLIRNYLLIGLIVAGLVILIIAITRTARGGRRS